MKVFITGASGYVGGDVLQAVASSTKADITALVRGTDKAKAVADAYPNIKVIEGDLDAIDVVEAEAKAADIVLNFASTSHPASANAIVRGLKSRSSVGYWVQMAGATIVSRSDIENKRFGEPPEASYDDVADVKKIISAITGNEKRQTENLVVAQTAETIKTALIIGPLIYGVGKGPVHQRSIQAPEIARNTLERGKGFVLERGLNVWSNVHVHDISTLIVKLVEAAEADKEGVWNHEGIYNVENGKMSFGDLGRAIAKSAYEQKLIKTAEVDTVDAAAADSFMGHGSIMWGSNAETIGSRGEKLLGWKRTGASLKDEIPAMVASEAK